MTVAGKLAGKLEGKTALVTGGNAGIGLETAALLAADGADVVITTRDATKGEGALAEIRRRVPSAKPSFLICDFSSQAAIRKLAAEVRAAHPRLDILVNNAGGVAAERKLTGDGIEQTFAVNHLGPFLLTNLLLDLLEASAPARVVTVASVGHRRGTMDFDDLGFAKGGYSIMSAYGRSKLGNVLFTRDLARRTAGKSVTALSLHPGAVATDIWAGAPWWARPILAVAKLFMITPAQGGAHVAYLATSPDVESKSGGYFENDHPVPPSPIAQDDAVAARLWTESARLTGLPATAT